MAVQFGTVTYDVLLRPVGSEDEPRVVGQIVVELDGKLPPPPVPVPPLPAEPAHDESPHSRACGITAHDHGPQCSADCPTCHGEEI